MGSDDVSHEALLRELEALRERVSELEARESGPGDDEEARERLLLAHIELLESLSELDRELRRRMGDLGGLTDAVTRIVHTRLGVDRAFLMRLVDVEGGVFDVFSEHTTPEFPGAALRGPVQADAATRDTMKATVAGQLQEAVALGPGGDAEVPGFMREEFGVRALLAVGMYPTLGPPWVLGLHQCSYDRVWTREERHLLVEFGRRSADAISVALMLQSVRDSAEQHRAILESVGDGVIATDPDGVILQMNPIAEALTGLPRAEAQGQPLRDVFKGLDPDTREPTEDPATRLLKIGKDRATGGEIVLVARDGTERTVSVGGNLLRGSEGSVDGVVLAIRDVTEERQLQNQLRESDKMRAIGQLAGGVAHDFNNLLTGILGHAQLLRLAEDTSDDCAESAQRIEEAAERASELTRQLLAFSRRTARKTEPVDLHRTVDSVISLLERSIDKRIRIRRELQATPCVVDGDASQLQNALLNLAVNARDAMPDGGELTFATQTLDVDSKFSRRSGEQLSPGPHIEISVADTGAGIDPKLRKRIFEPFFTTKPAGEGTGLGLAGVYGCARSHDGLVTVESIPSHGATFRVLLPLSQREISTKKKQTPRPAQQSGRILIVDDEPTVLQITQSALERLGYETTVCQFPRDAIETFRAQPGHFDLVLLDLMMPEISGAEVFAALREVRPDVPVIIWSGYSETSVEPLLQQGAAAFLPKPFKLSALAHEVARHISKS